jgi:ketosteroid isomerase-like protein
MFREHAAEDGMRSEPQPGPRRAAEYRSPTPLWYRGISTLGSTLLLAGLFGCASTAPASASLGENALEVDAGDEARILRVLEEQAEAWNRADLDGFLAGYADSPEMVYASRGEFVHGRAALKQRYQKNYPTGKQGQLAFRTKKIVRLGADSYLVLGEWALQRPPDDPRGVFTLVFRRDADGLWIYHDHSSGVEPEESEAEDSATSS